MEQVRYTSAELQQHIVKVRYPSWSLIGSTFHKLIGAEDVCQSNSVQKGLPCVSWLPTSKEQWDRRRDGIQFGV